MKLLFQSYLIMGCFVCLWFGVAAFNGWKIPRPDMSGGTSSGGSSFMGRSYGGFWGGGK